jgi:Xaa-Pro aminopeptidase
MTSRMSPTAAQNIAAPYFQTAFPIAELARRRAAVADAIGNAIAVLQGMPATGAFDLFRQHNNFFYLCGAETPHAYLTVDGRSGHSVLYLPPGDPKLAEQEGAELNADIAETAVSLTGIDVVKPLAALKADLAGADELYTCHQPPEARQACQDTLRHARHQAERDPWRPATPSFAQTLGQLCPSAEICDLSPILNALRLIKSPAELDVMRRAGWLTAAAVCEAMRSTAAGLVEGQLGAVADYVFRLNGAAGAGYRPIIACGENIWNMHYWRNNCQLVAGELVLMDYAPDYSCYTSDIGRMWPVSGHYNRWQRELYGFVVDYHLTLLELIGPGKTCAEICRQAADRLLPIVERTRWERLSFAEAARTLLTSEKQFTHTVGMAVHDNGQYTDKPLVPGIVFALDPQLWVAAERLYIRVEDTVAITEKGVENLTPNCPLQLDEVEQIIREPGLIQSRPDLLLDAGAIAAFRID